MDFHPDTGFLYGVGKRSSDGVAVLITIDPNTGAGRETGPLTSTLRGPFDLSFRNGDSILFALAFSQINPCSSLYTIDPISGTATEIGDTTTCASGDALGFSPADTLYQANSNGAGILHTVDQVFGTSTIASALNYVGFPALNDPRPNAMDFNPATGKAFVSVNDGLGGSGPNYLASLDPNNGWVIHIGITVNGLDALAYGPLFFGPRILAAPNLVDFIWQFPLDYLWIRGPFVTQFDIGSYPWDTSGSGFGTILSDPTLPAVGAGLWYLLRPDCTEGSWSSGGPGGRDGVLP